MKITKRMTKLIIIGVAITVFLTAGIFSLVMGLSRVEYGMNLRAAYIQDISFWSPEREGILSYSDDTRGTHARARNDMFEKLNDAGQTNRLFQIFQSSGSQRITWAPLGTRHKNDIRSNSGEHFIRIRFVTPQYAIAGTYSRDFRLVTFATNPNATPIHQIFIPLNATSNSFEERSWYLNTDRHNEAISHRLITWGNFRDLANFVRDLEILN
ncbi:MAG: hypothetical protein FWE45_01390 [Firmicutes bacterium]|nr:hypothetical protein [Bacillota bacterium]